MAPIAVSAVVPKGRGDLSRQALRKALGHDLGLECTRLKRKILKGRRLCWLFLLPEAVDDKDVGATLQKIEAHELGLKVKCIIHDESTPKINKTKKRVSTSHDIGVVEVIKRVAAIFDFYTGDMATVLRNITQTACLCVKANRASVFFVDKKTKELYSKAFDETNVRDAASDSGEDADNDIEGKKVNVFRFPMSEGIAGYVASTGNSVRLDDAYKDERFNEEVDKQTGYKTKSVACVALRHGDEILGILQVVNCQTKSGVFTRNDIKLLEEFARLSSVAVYNRRLHLRSVELETRGRLAMQMLVRDTMPNVPAIDAMMKMAEDNCTIEGLENPAFDCRKLSDVESIYSVYQMFRSIGLIDFFNTTTEKVIRLIMTVKGNYRDVPYHNWRHAFEVVHSCYSIIVTAKLKDILQPRQVYALLVATLVHDVDHRGRNNTFIISAEKDMMSAYGTESTLEQHHYAVFLSLISPNELNIFLEADSDLRDWVIKSVQRIILSTDLASHFPSLKNLQEIDEINFKKRSQVELLVSLVMTCSDINASARPWESHEKVTHLIYKEFYEQGDVEKSLGLTPIPMMDRELANIPAMQGGFFDFVALPAFEELARHLPATKHLLLNAKSNAQKWKSIKAAQSAADADVQDSSRQQHNGDSDIVLPSL